MRKERTDLKPFNMVELNLLRKRRQVMAYGKSNQIFLNELEYILRAGDYNPNSVWTHMEKDGVVIGDVWSQPIGTFVHKNKLHQYTYLYVESKGLAIGEHSHEEEVHSGKHIAKLSEWYIFPDGKMELCRKNCKHKLVNNTDGPLYVISLKIRSRKSS